MLFLVIRTCQRFEPNTQRPANPLGCIETHACASTVPCLNLTNGALWHTCLYRQGADRQSPHFP